MSPVTFGILVAVAIVMVAIAALSVALLVTQARSTSRVQRRLRGMGGQDNEFEDSARGVLFQLLAGPGRAIDRVLDDDGETQHLMFQAGWRQARQQGLYFAVQAIAPVLTVTAVIFGGVLSDDGNALLKLLGVFLAVGVGLLGPRYVLRKVATGRRRRIEAEIPMLIHILVLLFEAGLSTRQAIASLVRDGGGVLPVLGEEFAYVLRQLEAGGDTGDVLKSAAQQLDVADLTSVLAVIRQVERYGGEVRGPLLEALEILEERRSLDLREQVNLMSGRMTVVMVAFFFPALLIFVAGPAFVSIISALQSVGD